MSNPRAESAIPPYHQFMWPVLKALEQLGRSAAVSEIDQRAADLAGLTVYQKETPHGQGPKTEVGYRIAWALSYLKKAGAVENSQRGVWSITDAGLHITEGQIPEILNRIRKTLGVGRQEPDPPAEAQTWQEGLLQILQSLPPATFERLCQRVLRESGLADVEVLGKSGDGGIDGRGVLRMGLLTFSVAFQSKRYRDAVASDQVRNFRGAIAGRADKALLITTGRFTRDAKQEASRDGVTTIDLIDGEGLCNLLKELHLGVLVRQVEEVVVEPRWFEDL